MTARPTHVSTKSHIDALNLRTHRVILWVVTRHQPETVYEWYAALLREQRARERQEPLVCLTVAGTPSHTEAIMAQQPQNNADEPLPSCYRELYSTASYQAGEPEANRLLSSYRFTEAAGGGERPTPANLREQTFAFGERRSMAFLCLSRLAGTQVEVRVLHHMMRYYELPGGDDGGGADVSMGLLGDVRATQVPVVEVDNSHFSLIGGAGIRVPTTATMLDQLEAAPPGLYLGPFAADALGTELVRPRTTQVLPIKYAAALVHRDRVAPDEAYRELYGLLEADGALESCADVLTWLRVACTARGGGGDLAALPAVALRFNLLLLPAPVSEYVANKVKGELPGRQAGLTGSGSRRTSHGTHAGRYATVGGHSGGRGRARRTRAERGRGSLQRDLPCAPSILPGGHCRRVVTVVEPPRKRGQERTTVNPTAGVDPGLHRPGSHA